MLFNVNILKNTWTILSALAVTTGNFLLLIIPSLLVLWYSDFFQTFNYTGTSYTSLVYVSLLAVFGTAFAKTLFNHLVKLTSPIFASSVTFLIPIVAVIWGLLDHENLSYIQLLAGILILFGVYLTNRK